MTTESPTIFVIYLDAVKKDGMSLQYIDTQSRTEDICLAAVQQYGNFLKDVTTKTEAICLAAVQQNGLALQYVPSGVVTPTIRLKAIQQNPYALNFITHTQAQAVNTLSTI